MKKIFYGKNTEQFGELRLPEEKGPYPVMIIIHGGFWKKEYDLSLMQKIAEDLTNEGWATWNVEYRRVGHENGGFPETFIDVGNACDFIFEIAKKEDLNLNQVCILGHSAGGHLALWTAARNKISQTSDLYMKNPINIHGCVSLAGVNDLASVHDIYEYKNNALDQYLENPVQKFMKQHPAENTIRYKESSPIEMIPLNIPQIIVHGAMDIHIPIGISEKYVNVAKKTEDQVVFLRLPEAEHFMLIDIQSTAWSEVKEAIKYNFKKSK